MQPNKRRRKEKAESAKSRKEGCFTVLPSRIIVNTYGFIQREMGIGGNDREKRRGEWGFRDSRPYPARGSYCGQTARWRLV